MVRQDSTAENTTEITFNFKAMTQNSYYRKFRNRLIICKEGREYKSKIQKVIEDGEYKKIIGKVSLDLAFEFKDKRKRDLDNLHKCFIDAIKNILIEDDDMIYDIHMTKKIGQKDESIHLILKPLI